MAVYKRTYAAYQGSFTPAWSRFMILHRYSFARLWQSRFLVMFFMASFFYPLGCVAYIYLSNNLSVLSSFGIPAPLSNFLKVDSSLFLYFCWVQGAFAYLLTAFIGPSLVSPDLVNGAMPLYLCRPFSRAEYVLGKMSVLIFLLSVVTWIPGLILFVIQAGRMGVDHGQRVDRRCINAGDACLDHCAVPDRPGGFGLGQVEDRGGRAGPGRVFRRRGIWHGVEQRDAHAVRDASKPDAGDVHHLVAAVPRGNHGGHLGSIGMDLPGRGLRHLPVDAAEARATL